MTFVNPLLLAGTALVALPIVLHLIMRRKPRRFEFPALRFIQKRHNANQRRLRLRHLLLLALRIAAIVLLAFALARPSIKLSGAWGTQEAPVAAALVFDTSKRMEYRHENRTRLDEARELGLWVLTQLPQQSQIAVLDTRRGPGAFQVDRGAAKHRIQRLETLASSQSLTAALAEAVRLLEESELTRREIYVFTDMARAGWPSQSAGPLQDRLARMADVGVYVIDVGIDEPSNSALGELKLSSQVLSNRSRLKIDTEIAHRGPAGNRTVELHLLEGEGAGSSQTARRGAQTLALEAGQSQSIRFEAEALGIGTHQGYVGIVGQDGLACDDRRYFTVEVKPAWRILVAAPTAPKPAESYALFLSQMLSPDRFRRSGRARFECDVVPLDELPKRDLTPYSAVCLLDPTPLEPTTWEELGDFVSAGGGLGIFLGGNATPIKSFNQPAAQEVLPARLLRQARRPDGRVHLAPRDYQHPILAKFRSFADSIPWDSPVYRYWQLDELAAGAHVVVPFNDGEPAIVERPLGNGRVLTVTTPVSDDPRQQPWNLLPVYRHGPFFMLVNQMASYLVGAGQQQLNYFAGQTAVLQLDPQRTFRSYVLTALDAPDAVDIRVAPDLREHLLMVTSTDNLGNYRVAAGGSASGVDLGFSVNLTPEQTRLERLEDEALAAVLGPLEYRVARDRHEIEGGRSMQRIGRELFGLLILLVAVALAAEHVVANRFYKD